MDIEYLTPAEVAKILKISTDTVIRKFFGRPGVVNLGSPERRYKQRHRVLRIPREALRRFIFENQAA